MKVFNNFAFISSLFCLLFAVGCGDKDNPTSSQNIAVGTWTGIQASDTCTIVTKADGTFTMKVAASYPMVQNGTYTLSGDSITFAFTLCLGGTDSEGIPCPSGNAGKISGNSMTGIFSFDGSTVTLTKK
jgi:hypothetical protein